MEGQHLDAKEGTKIPAKGEASLCTGIAIGLPHNTYEQIAPRSSLAVKYRLMPSASVIDADYTGEIKGGLANLADQRYRVEKRDQIAQLSIEKRDNKEREEVAYLDDTE